MVATSKSEHSGCARGVEFGVGITYYFEVPACSSSPSIIMREELESVMTNIRQQVMKDVEASFEACLEAQLAKMKEEMMTFMTSQQETTTDAPHTQSLRFHSTKDINVLGRVSEGPLVGNTNELCKLYLKDLDRCLVTLGSVHTSRQTIHHRQMQEDHVRVVVDVKVLEVLVPCPPS